MLFISLTLLLGCVTCLLWWQLSRAQQLNAQLQAELTKLRARARALRD